MEARQQQHSDSDKQDLGVEEMAEGVDTIARHTFTKEKQPQVMSELSYHKSPQQDHAPSYPQPTQGQD